MEVKELQIAATIENVAVVTEFVEEQLAPVECPVKAKMQINIAIDELFSNIARYAYDPEVGPATVRVEVIHDPLSVVITFIDHGVQYDPLEKEDPKKLVTDEDDEIGGLGIYLVKQTMDALEYEYRDGQNILKIKKNL